MVQGGGRAFVGPLGFALGGNDNQIDYLYTDTAGLAAAAAIKMTWWREEVCWNFAKGGGGTFQGIELTPGTRSSTSAGQVASTVATIKANGQTPLLVVTVNANPGLSSTWSSGPPCTPAQFAASMAWLVAQPGLQGLHWELFNEPDGSAWGITPSLLTQAFQLTYPAMKAADSTCFVHFSPTEDFGLNQGNQGIVYLNNCYAALANLWNYYDFGGLHGYQTLGGTYVSPDSWNSDYGVPYWLGVAQFQHARITAGDTKPLMITEVGYPGGGSQGNATTQSQWLQTLLAGLNGYDPLNGVPFSSYLKAVMIFGMSQLGAYWTVTGQPAATILAELVSGH